jgi:hypothetical protein
MQMKTAVRNILILLLIAATLGSFTLVARYYDDKIVLMMRKWTEILFCTGPPPMICRFGFVEDDQVVHAGTSPHSWIPLIFIRNKTGPKCDVSKTNLKRSEIGISS